MIGSPEYEDAIAENNGVSRRVAREMGVPVLDLAKLMPSDRQYFTDGVHFTEEGNAVMAHLIGSLLIDGGLMPRAKRAEPDPSGKRP